LIDFLDNREKLFNGEEFTKECFPRSVYEHDVELTEPLTHLNFRPFLCRGIQLSQLKADINELCKNSFLSPGDSSFTSPCFYVLKKSARPGGLKGHLCFDYRKLNTYVKIKNFPLTTTKNFFDNASKFKFFAVSDIQNAFLSIGLSESTRKFLAIITPFGIFLPNRTPFCLRISPSALCFALKLELGDLPFIQAYMDDLHIGAETERELIDNLEIVLTGS